MSKIKKKPVLGFLEQGDESPKEEGRLQKSVKLTRRGRLPIVKCQIQVVFVFFFCQRRGVLVDITCAGGRVGALPAWRKHSWDRSFGKGGEADELLQHLRREGYLAQQTADKS